jgi:integrase
MKAKITAKLIGALKPSEKTYSVRDTDIPGFLVRVTPKGLTVFYVDNRLQGGTRKKYRIGPAANLTIGQARTIAKQVLGEVANGHDPQAAKVEARRVAEVEAISTLGGFLAGKYGPWVEVERKTGAATVARLKACFGDLADQPMAEITHWQIEKWRATRKKAGRKQTTLNRDVTALKAALSKAVDWEIIGSNPLAGLRQAKADNASRVRYLDPDEEQRLRRALRGRGSRIKTDRRSANQWRRVRGYSLFPDLDSTTFADYLEPMVILAMNTGLRRGELFNLEWCDIDTGGALLTVQGHGAKSGKTRHIPLNREALATMAAWKAQSSGTGLVFPSPKTGERMDNISTAWKKLMHDSEIVAFRFHDIRHSFASSLVMAGVDLNTVRELLGHADLKMTLRYAHLAPKHKAQAVELLSRPNNVVSLPTALEATQ